MSADGFLGPLPSWAVYHKFCRTFRLALGGLAEYALERGLCVFSVDSIAHISNIGDITKEDKMLCSKLSRKEFFG